MKKLLFAFWLIVAAGVVIAGSVSHTLPAAGDATINGYGVQIVYDSTDAHNKVNRDTALSNVLDISNYGAIGLWSNLGDVVVCDSCNDSIKIIIETLLRGATSTQWFKARTDTMGGNNIAVTFDDSTKYKWIKLDTIPCNEIMFRTIIVDSIKQISVGQDSSETATVATHYTTLIPLHYVVVGR